MKQHRFALRFRKGHAPTLSALAARAASLNEKGLANGFRIAAAAAKAGQPMGLEGAKSREEAERIAQGFVDYSAPRPTVLEASLTGWVEA